MPSSPKRQSRPVPKQPVAPVAPPADDPEASVVTAFRVKRKEVKGLVEALPNIVTGNSHHLLARKLLRDFVDGKLVYLNRRDKLNSREGEGS